MPVDNSAHGIGDGLVHVIAFDEDGEKAGYAPLPCFAGACAFQKPSEFAECGGRVAFGGWWLSSGQADFALCHGKAGDGIDEAEDFFALIAEIFGNGEGHVGGLAAHQGGFITRCDDNDGAGKAVFTKIVL